MKRTLVLSLYELREWRRDAQALVVTPNPRAARAIGAPRCTLRALARDWVFSQGWGVAPAHKTCALLRRAVAQAGPCQDIDGTARVVLPAVQELLRSNAPLEELQADSTPRTQRLARIALLYRKELRRHKWLDDSEILLLASQLSPPPRRLVLCGYPRLDLDALLFLDAAAGDGSEIYLPFSTHPLFADHRRSINFLESHGWAVQPAEDKPQTPGEHLSHAFLNKTAAPSCAVGHLYPNIEAEARGVLTQVKELLCQGVHANQIVLVARNEKTYGPHLLDIGDEYGLPIRALYSIPLRETRLGAWLELAFECILDKLPYESTVRMLAHPLGQEIPGLCWEENWNQWRRRHPAGLQEWQEEQLDLSALHWERHSTRAQYTDALLAVLESFKIRARCAYWSRELIGYYDFLHALDDLKENPTQSIPLEGFIAEAQELLNTLSVPVMPGRGGVELHTPFSLFGTKYDYVFVLGAAEGILPAPPQEDLVLDSYERELLAHRGCRLERSIDRAQGEWLNFWMLLKSVQKSIVFSYPLLSDTQEMFPSVFFHALGVLPQLPQFQSIPSEEESRIRSLRIESSSQDDPVLELAQNAWRVEHRREYSAGYDEFDGMVGQCLDPRCFVFSASRLLDIGQCPFKWFSNAVLRLREGDEQETELSYASRGQFLHRVLQRLAEQGREEENLREFMLAHLEKAFTELERETGVDRLPAWKARRPELRRQIKAAIAGDDFLHPGAQVLTCEQPFECEWHGLRIKGFIDRIDQDSNGLILLDYKSGSSKPAGIKDENGDAKVDLQLPLYIHAAQTALFPKQFVVQAYYYSLKKHKTLYKVKEAQALPDFAPFAETIHRSLQTGSFPVSPDNKRQACQFCSYQSLCRTGSRLSRKGAVQ